MKGQPITLISWTWLNHLPSAQNVGECGHTSPRVQPEVT